MQLPASHSSCQQSCLTKISASLHCNRFFVFYFIKHKIVVWEKSEEKLTSKNGPATHSDKSVSTLRERLFIP